MDYFFITGTSRGIGKALAEEILKINDTKVLGFARSKSIENENYIHKKIDLSDIESLKSFKFPKLENAEKIILINNSGVLGELAKVGNLDDNDIINTLNINTIAPIILMNKFIKSYQEYPNDRIIINISSGAGRRPVSSWATYCTSKSGLDMFSETTAEEQKELETKNQIKILSVAPGVIDTQMQNEIRATKKENFSGVERFINMKNEKLLISPELTAKKLLKLIEKTKQNYFNNKVLIDLRID